MHKTAFVVLAALSLSACVSLTPLDAMNAAAPAHHAAADAGPLTEAESCVDEPVVVTEHGAEAPQDVIEPVLLRRAFGHPTRRQPDLRLIAATAADRRYFRRGRRRARRSA
jgi:hypothetical protein